MDDKNNTIGIIKKPRTGIDKKDMAFIEDNYSHMTISELYDHFEGKYPKADIKSHLRKKGIRKEKKYDLWTEEEDRIIKEYYPNEGVEVKKRLQGRRISAVKSRARKLGVKSGRKRDYSSLIRTKWTEEDLRIIKENHNKCSMDELVELIDGRHSATGIYFKLKAADLVKSKFRWTEDEIQFLKDNYGVIPVKILAKNFHGRHNADAIYSIVSRLGIKKKV